MKKCVIFLLICVLGISLFSVNVFAEEEFNNCQEYCADFWMSAMPACPGEKDVSGVYPDCNCDWKCYDDDGEKGVDEKGLTACRDECKRMYDNEEERSKCISGCKSDFGFINSRDDYKCEDMTQKDCELADDCEGVFGPSFCEGDVCTTDMVWQGCRVEGGEIYEGYEDAELEQDAGATPGSAFYFVDKFFDKFGDEIKVKEERIAEIKAMVEAGDLEGAKIALEDYIKLAEELEKEIDPERREEAKRSAAAIRAVMKDIRDNLPEGERGEFVSEIMNKEHKIATAAEISFKIKDLCVQLAQLDPEMFYESCRVGEEGPRWQKDLYKDLTKEQIAEAKEFGKIMKSCFKTSGQDCRCEDISFPEFSKACSIAAPLATACDIEGDEASCNELDNLEMPELPPHLQHVMDELERGMMHEKFDMHMPPECVEAGAKTPKECSKVMIKKGAPPECKQALLDSGCKSERECREICDKIMMKKHSPECLENGITDPEECKDFMWNIDRRPPECVSHQIHDYRDCQKFLKEGGTFKTHDGPRINFDCKSIQDPMERLDCFDKASSGFNNFKEDFEGIKRKERECADKCHREGRPWDFTGGECSCGEPGQHSNNDGTFSGGYYSEERGYYEESECKDGCHQECPGASRTDCVNERCECYYEDDSSHDDYQDYDSGDDYSGEGSSSGEGDTSGSDDSSSSDDGGSSDSGDDSSSSDSGGEGGDAGITGNAFLNYYS